MKKKHLKESWSFYFRVSITLAHLRQIVNYFANATLDSNRFFEIKKKITCLFNLRSLGLP